MAKGRHIKEKNAPLLPLVLLGLVIMLGGAGVFLYPAVADLYARSHQAGVIQTYTEAVDHSDEARMAAEWEEARIYNENLLGDPVHDPFVPGSGYVLPGNYREVLDLDENGVMAYISIPAISVELPVYHGTGEDVLQKGVGHIRQTALPIGGEGRHAVLTGHRGLTTARLFTDLDELEEGDLFYITVLDTVLAYEVCAVTTVLPYELEALAAEQGRDLVTLVTCTPYGVNTHRLLVTGERTEYSPQRDYRDVSRVVMELREMDEGSRRTGIAVGIGLLVLLLLALLIFGRRRRRR